MGPRWALVFCLFVLGIARSAQGDSRFPLYEDSKDKKMTGYGDGNIPEWNKAGPESVAMNDGSQQPFMTRGAVARDGMNTGPGLLARGPKGGGRKGKYDKGKYDKGKYDKGKYDKGKYDKGKYDKGKYGKGGY